MNPSPPLLLVIAGPARGRSLPVEGRIVIGRDEHSTVAIPDVALSRQHCEITPTTEGVVLNDLESRNGSWVNGKPVTTHRLADGDQIRIGDTALLFVASAESAASTTSDLAFDDTPLPENTTVAIGAEDARYNAPAHHIDTGSARASRDLAVLLQASAAFQNARSREELYSLILSAAREAVSADTAAILTSEPAGKSLAVAAIERQPGGVATISRTLASRALRDRAAILVADMTADARFAAAASIAGSGVHAALCAPLISGDTVAGALYLTRGPNAPAFTEDELHVLAGIGSIGGLALDRIQHLEWLESENTRLRHDAAIDHEMIGESAAAQAVYRFIARAAEADATVLIRGESGTGKELVARAIHDNSPRARGPFVAINCAALPEALLESELFGHERGAFTGAVAQVRGRLELADRGTVFLDEIGELATTLQAKLLRVLQDHVVERVGGRRGIPIDVRVIAATNRDLESAIAGGQFRQDLYYRLNVVSTTVPPLRQRREDIPLLAVYFVRKHSVRCKRTVRGISPEARTLLLGYDWPGNVRELENALERAVVLGSTDVIHPDDLPEALLEGAAEHESSDTGFHGRVAAHKRAVIKEALDKSAGNVAKAARDLRLQPTYLHRLIRQLGVREDRT